MAFTAFVAAWYQGERRWPRGGRADAIGLTYHITRNDLRDHLAKRSLEGDTLITQDAERHIVDVLWPAGEDVTCHFYEQVFNRAVWRQSKGKKAEIWDSRNLAAGLSIEAI